ncbi:hypothetical protein [Ramlibacter sp.]|uniref:hypothetical protein n=1 Tax=Ramlibacter sp. TaxID=1917967 RepID=UPI003D14891C
MSVKYVENPTAQTIFVGGKMIPPGEGREIPIHLLPSAASSAPAADVEQPDAASELAKLLELSIKALLPELHLLDDEQLRALDALEQSAAGRKGVTSAIQELLLERGDTQLQIATAGEALEAARAKLAALTADAPEVERFDADTAVSEAEGDLARLRQHLADISPPAA